MSAPTLEKPSKCRHSTPAARHLSRAIAGVLLACYLITDVLNPLQPEIHKMDID